MPLSYTLEATGQRARAAYEKTGNAELGKAMQEAIAVLKDSDRRRSSRNWEQDIRRAIAILEEGLLHAS